MGGSSIQNATTVESTDFTGKIADDVTNKTLICEIESTVTITGTNLNLEYIKKVLFTIDTQSIYIDVRFDEGGRNFWEKVSVEKNEIVLKTIKGRYYQLSRSIVGNAGDNATLKGATKDIAQGTITEAYTSSFPLTEIDDLREYILSKGREQIRIGKDSDAKLKSLFNQKIS